MLLKKVGLLFILPTLVCACGSDEEIHPKLAEVNRNEVSAFRLSPQEAVSAVSDFYQSNRRMEFVVQLRRTIEKLKQWSIWKVRAGHAEQQH